MPKALKVDKELAKSLFVQGVKNKNIAQRLGVKPKTVTTWSLRYKWHQLATKTRQELEATQQPLLAEAIAQKSVLVRQRLADDIVEATEHLPRHSRTPKAFAERQGAVQALVSNAKTVFCWGEEQPRSTINIALLTVEPDLTAQAAAIDVNTVIPGSIADLAPPGAAPETQTPA